MQNSAELLRVTLRSIRDAVVTVDPAARVESINRAAEVLTGWTREEAEGLPVETVIDLRDAGQERHLANPVYAALRDGVKIELPGEVPLMGKGGLRAAVEVCALPLHDTRGELSGAVLILHDLSEALRLAERKFYQAHHDPLTALPNRILLVDRMEQATKFADRHSDQMAVLSLDIDHFAQINATHGRTAADELLKEVALRVAEALRESDTVCRLGADDFVILLPGVTSRADVEALAAKLLRVVSRPFPIGEQEVEATCSIGVSLYPKDAIDAGTLMRLADGALAEAKRGGRGRCVFAGAEERV